MNFFRPTMLVAESMPDTAAHVCMLADRRGFDVIAPTQVCRSSIMQILDIHDVHTLFLQHRIDKTGVRSDFIRDAMERIPVDFHDCLAIIINVPPMFNIEESERIYEQDGATAVVKYHAGIHNSMDDVKELFDHIWEEWNPSVKDRWTRINQALD